jgi:hypothetical protein
MKYPVQESVFYSPWSGWIADRREVHFNKDILCEGEPLKVIATTRRENPFYSTPVLRIYALDEDEERYVIAENKLVSGSQLFAFVQVVGTGAEELLKPGAYVAEVLDSEDETRSRVEHRFQVVERETYYNELRELFGDEWDEPIYWNQMKGPQAEVLMCGLPLENLLFSLPADFEWNADTILPMIGPVAVSLMGDRWGRLPGLFDFSLPSETSERPHLDLTKVIWTLNVMGPALRDFIFGMSWIYVSVEVTSERLEIDLSSRAGVNILDRHEPGLMIKSPPYEWRESASNMFRFLQATLQDSFKSELSQSADRISIRFFSSLSISASPARQLASLR